MLNLIDLSTFSDKRGDLTVIEKQIPFQVKRVFYIYNVDDSKRGFHKHKKTRQFAICINGSCNIIFQQKNKEIIFKLDSPTKGLYVRDLVWREMHKFSHDCVLLVLASQEYDELDYIRNYADFKRSLNHE